MCNYVEKQRQTNIHTHAHGQERQKLNKSSVSSSFEKLVMTALGKLKRKLAGPLQELVTFPAPGGWGGAWQLCCHPEARGGIRPAGGPGRWHPGQSWPFHVEGDCA